jgi:hypothetical protein
MLLNHFRGIMLLNHPRAVLLLDCTGGVVWALKSPSEPLRGQVGGGWALEIESFLGSVGSCT